MMVHLDTLGGIDVRFPRGTEILRGVGFETPPRVLTEIDEVAQHGPDAIMDYVAGKIRDGLREQLFEEFKRQNGRYPESVLFVLSDDTRPRTTPRATLKALLDLCEEMEAEGTLPQKITLITGTGTHKTMVEDETRHDFSGFFGREEYARLEENADRFHIQRDPRTGYPVLQHKWDVDIVDMDTQLLGRPVQVNKVMLEHEAIAIAADVDLHPYMGASGGPYKFCIIGIGGKGNFSTHSPAMLTSPTTLPGTFEDNGFFRAVKGAALGVLQEAKANGQLRMDPVSVNVVLDYYRDGKPPHDLIIGPIGEGWEEAAGLIFSAYRGPITKPSDVLVVCVERAKGYEFLAAMRPLANDLATNRPDNQILPGNIDGRVGVVFNPCIFSDKQVGGLSTPATYVHLCKLKSLARANMDAIVEDVADVRDLGDVVRRLRAHRNRILGEWYQYIEDEFEAEGNLGEGGQRTIRLWRILKEFGAVYLGTTNDGYPPEITGTPIPLAGYEKKLRGVYGPGQESDYEHDLLFRPVAEFLSEMSPDITDRLHPDVRRQLGDVRLTVLGLRALQLGGLHEQIGESASSIVDLAIAHHRLVTGEEPNVRLLPDMHTLAELGH